MIDSIPLLAVAVQRIVSALCLAVLAGGARAVPQQVTVTLLATGDTEGHVSPCRTCPQVVGLGGLARRATLVKRQRADGPTLLVDAGNALHGAESLATQGAVIVAAYEVMGYDALNVGYRDFRLGKRATLEALQTAVVPTVSANLYHAGEQRRIFAPFVVRERGGLRWAIVGVTEAPAHLSALPHLQRQLEGIDVRDPLQALTAVLPDAQAASDAVVVLYYGSARSARELSERSTAAGVRAVIVGGDSLASDAPPTWPESWLPVAWTHEHGMQVTRLTLDDSRATLAEQLEVTPDLEPDVVFAEAIEPLRRSGRAQRTDHAEIAKFELARAAVEAVVAATTRRVLVGPRRLRSPQASAGGRGRRGR